MLPESASPQPEGVPAAPAAPVPRLAAVPSAAVARRPAPISRVAQLPGWTRVRTGPGGSIPVSSADRAVVAVLDLEEGGVVILHVTNVPGWPTVIAGIEARLRQEGETHIQRIETEAGILAIVYDNLAQERGALQVGETEQGTLFNELLVHAVLANASDIHLQVDRRVTQILIRVHGDLTHLRSLSGTAGQRLARAIFAMADDGSKAVDFMSEPFQDARITREIAVGNKKVQLQLRFAAMATHQGGFDVTLRILRTGASALVLQLEQLGYDPDQIAAIHTALSRPIGMVALCGPTGSGKSTTLASCCDILHVRYQGRRLIRTIEDPPEYEIPGARQTPVIRGADGRSAGFGQALRAGMRGDPDILLVGEVRDDDTGQLAMEAVMTGHKLLTTVHAASPFDAIDRLIDKGFRRQIISADDILSGIIYQRLIPVVCQNCALSLEDATPHLARDHIERVERHFPGDLRKARYRGEGCSACNHTGVSGRTVAASMLLPDRDIRAAINADDRVTAQAYWRAHQWSGALAINGHTALEQGMAKMARGLVAPIDVEHDLGELGSEETRDEARRWLDNRSRGQH